MGAPHAPPAVRFERHVDRNGPMHPVLGTRCWLWTGALDDGGYGGFFWREQSRTGMVKAHRAAYLLAYGSLDPSLDVCHKCDNPPCVNPSHLFQGTETDNMRDAIAKGRQKPPVAATANRLKTHCKRGHEFTPENTKLEPSPGYTARRCRICIKEKARWRWQQHLQAHLEANA